MTDERWIGPIEKYPDIYERLKPFGVPASVWDEVAVELFGHPVGGIAPPFQLLLYEMEMGRAKPEHYERNDGETDREFVRYILEHAKENFDRLSTGEKLVMMDE